MADAQEGTPRKMGKTEVNADLLKKYEDNAIVKNLCDAKKIAP